MNTMRKFKKAFNIFAIAIIAVSLTKCKGKEEEEMDDLEIETVMTESALPETFGEQYDSGGMNASEDYDKMLDDYEDYVNEYVKFYKKAMTGDQTAMAEYPAMMEKTSQLQISMEKAQNTHELSAAQISRMSKIQAKMLQAMQ